MNSDRNFMDMALRLARRGLGNTWPNPAVGCVLVAPAQGHRRVIGRGWTMPGGRPHAETVALDQARALFGADALRDAEAFVTLEPCSHTGKTPPCAEALIAAGVGRVISACEDPDPRVRGSGLEQLRAAGIVVESGLCEEEAAALNAGFFARVTTGRPRVTLKTATTADGRIATRTGASQWITGDAARARAHVMRAEHDAIAVGVETVLADDPGLTCRLPGLEHRSPVRVVFDTNLRTPAESALVRTAKDVPTWVICADDADKAAQTHLMLADVRVIKVPARDGHVDLPAALSALGDEGITRLMVEGGAQIATALLRLGLVDELCWFRAPSLIGGDGLPPFGDLGVSAMDEIAAFRTVSRTPVGDDMLDIFVRVP